jgi:arabinogalactan endo-1,4-beta-galactosidase
MKDKQEDRRVEGTAEGRMPTWVPIGVGACAVDMHIGRHEIGSWRAVQKLNQLVAEGLKGVHEKDVESFFSLHKVKGDEEYDYPVDAITEQCNDLEILYRRLREAILPAWHYL